MKRFILLFTLVAAFSMINAQKVTNILLVYDGKLYYLDGQSFEFPSNPPPAIQFPLVIQFTNNGDVLNAGDSMKMAMIIEGETKLVLSITLDKAMQPGDTSMINLQGLQVPTSEFKASNTWCFDITKVYRSGVEQEISEPACANFTVSTGIAEVSRVETMVYPNPAKDVISIKNTNNATVYIYNILGKMVRKIDSTSDLLQVNVSDFSNGMYFIKIQNGNNVETKKILINK
ncbi:MAG TPA: T9SS type A sorting domain-containing protein [Bacteroidales bacterium]|nr:T9SS type A sorting domain-containing protein [Bacteroidales bacterium]